MIEIENTLISDDVVEEFFVCDLNRCKGACCVEGDLGAPLEEEELQILPKIYRKIEPYLSARAKKVIKKKGYYIKDYQGDYSTPTIKGKECAYAVYDKNGILKCTFEQAYMDGKTDFRKPVSCHLYPVRLKKYEHYIAVNYDRWIICSSACANGLRLKVPLYRFLREAFTRKFGEDWFKKLESHAQLV